MSKPELLLTLAGSLIAVWLGLLVACLVWLGRRMATRGRREVHVVSRAARLRTRRALIDGIGAVAALCWLVAAALATVPLLLIVAPLLLTITGLDLTAHIVNFGR
jgi:ABC-type Fe3+ transport system permease subunit